MSNVGRSAHPLKKKNVGKKEDYSSQAAQHPSSKTVSFVIHQTFHNSNFNDHLPYLRCCSNLSDCTEVLGLPNLFSKTDLRRAYFEKAKDVSI